MRQHAQHHHMNGTDTVPDVVLELPLAATVDQTHSELTAHLAG